MAKTLIIEPDEKTRVPFLRGILTRSLQAAGTPFDAAYAIASEIRQELDDVEELPASKLREMTAEKLRGVASEKVVERYLAPAESRPMVYVEGLDGQISAYSDEHFCRELEIIGLGPEEMRSAVSKMHQHVIGRPERTISVNDLGYLTYRCLHQDPDYGPEIADRYLTWVNFSRSGRPLILLIGGTAATGKSTIATALAGRLEIVRTQSTDMLREVMRMMIPERLLPVLHTSSFKAWQTLPAEHCGDSDDREKMVIAGYRTQSELLSVPCEAVIQRALTEKVSLVLEGVHINPSLLEKIPKDNDAVVVHLMLAMLKQKQLKKRIKGRTVEAPQRRSERYMGNFEDIWALQAYLLDEADQAEIPIVVNDEKERVMRETMKIIINRLAKEFTATPKEVFGVNRIRKGSVEPAHE